MHTIKQRIDHTLDVFRQFSRQDIVVGLTPADWDALCALVLDEYVARRAVQRLTRDTYDGMAIYHLSSEQTSFVAHDFGTAAQRKFPLDVLEDVELTTA